MVNWFSAFAHAFSKPVVFFIFKLGWRLQNRFGHDSPTCLPEIASAHCTTDAYVMGIPRQPWILTHLTKISSWALVRSCSPTCASWRLFPPRNFQQHKITVYNTTYLSNSGQGKILEYQNRVLLDAQSSVGHHWVLYLIVELQLQPVGCVPLVVGWEYPQELRWKLAFREGIV